ncbi:molybdopterin-dependent oxidoreductase [Gemmobacter sp.]|uniref:molybdopterin-dependent oxidoreductase n=1 Tax=Gemmobacter sp. TaxID=1898957 RepID=UPI002AFE9DEB|nr:molybdopterin-dependent oxidoreductase [Gemmobacter sp.]
MLRIANLAVIATLIAPAALRADAPPPLPSPQGPPVLTVTGTIAVTNAGDAAVFDLAMLQSLGSADLRTSTPWTEGVQQFSGLPLFRLTERLGITEGLLFAKAINDYNAEIPIKDAAPGRALIAWEMNGAPIPPRGQGPLWVIYPYDVSTEFQSEVIYSRSIWQLDRIEVLPDGAP